MKKLLCVLLAIALLACAAVAESNVGTLFDAACALAFDTHNVALSAEATFSYDGELFKVLHASYSQDGEKSYLSYMLDTPQLDGSVYTGGYTVMGFGTTSYSNDTYYGNYYQVNANQLSDTVLTKNARVELALKAARALAVAAEDGLLVNEEKDGVYTFSLKDLPGYIDSAVYYMLLDYILDNYYRDLMGVYIYYDSDEPYVFCYYEDWNKAVEDKYLAVYGDDSALGLSEEARELRMELIVNMLNLEADELAGQYEDGIVYIKTDGSTAYYKTEYEYIRDTGRLYVQYADYDAAIADYYRSLYSAEFTEEMYDAIIFSGNEELWSKYVEFAESMEKHFIDMAREQNPDAVFAFVMKDGSVKAYADDMYYVYNTVTQAIFDRLAFAELKTLDATVSTDAEGRLTAFEGEALIEITDKRGDAHELNIEFKLSASEYGEVKLPSEFVPENYGLISYDEYEKLHEHDYDYEGDDGMDFDEFLKTLPAEVEFAGTTYETLITID